MSSDKLAPESGKRLLAMARQTVEAAVAERKAPAPPAPPAPDDPLNQQRGLFVTFHVDGQLRGCMGTFHPDQPLASLIHQMTLTSLADPRFVFNRIGPEELDRLVIEISILSPMWKTDRPLAEFRAGVHGVYVSAGRRSGCFLPQVATEMGWGAEEMLTNCCAGKAGLSPGAWRSPGTEVYLFTAQIFSEQGPDRQG